MLQAKDSRRADTMDISEVEDAGDGVLMVPSISDTKSLGGLKRKWKVNPTLPLHPTPTCT